VVLDSVKDIPAFLGNSGIPPDFGTYKMKIIAEIVDAHQFSLEQILARASYYRENGADIIDLAAPPKEVSMKSGKR
jgi:hypothetical protein